jgi:phosphoribosylformylglycinamidine synthase
MKATVIVTLKPTVLDPQGMTIQRGVQPMGFPEVTDIRQGKHFQIELQDGTTPERRKALVERLAKEVLTNAVTEQYKITWDPS